MLLLCRHANIIVSIHIISLFISFFFLMENYIEKGNYGLVLYRQILEARSKEISNQSLKNLSNALNFKIELGQGHLVTDYHFAHWVFHRKVITLQTCMFFVYYWKTVSSWIFISVKTLAFLLGLPEHVLLTNSSLTEFTYDQQDSSQ